MSPSPDPNLYRILDAAANRAREGLRVVEDYVRFHNNDANLARTLKELRHRLHDCLSRWRSDDWLPYRDTPGDVGTTISTVSEGERADLLVVVRANAKRVGEALRTLEEFGKVLDAEVARDVERIRYEFYEVERQACSESWRHRRLRQSQLYLLLTAAGCKRPWDQVAQESLAAGVDVIQLREKELPPRELLARAEKLRQWTRDAGALLIVNDRPDVAVCVDADGVHVGQDDWPVDAARRVVGLERLVGLSTHNLDQLTAAQTSGADYLGVGPVFASGTKQFTNFAGLEYVAQAAKQATLPWFAIGGIDVDNVPQLVDAGATRVAVSGAVCRSDDPAGVVRALRARLPTMSVGPTDAPDSAD